MLKTNINLKDELPYRIKLSNKENKIIDDINVLPDFCNLPDYKEKDNENNKS